MDVVWQKKKYWHKDSVNFDSEKCNLYGIQISALTVERGVWQSVAMDVGYYCMTGHRRKTSKIPPA